MQHRRTSAVFHHRLPNDAVELRQRRIPVIGVLLDDKLFCGIEGNQRIGPRAAGIKGRDFLALKTMRILEETRTDHLRVRHRQTANESSERCLQRKTHLVRIEHLDLFDEFVDVVARELIVGIKQPVKVGLDGVGRELGSVMELDALFQGNRPDLRIG